MPQPPLACTVRGCGRPLHQHGRQWTCPAGHHFDISRRGYVNLLQPGDRRSSAAGDSRAAIEARARLRAAGIGRTGFDRFVAEAVTLLPRGGDEPALAVDLGSGSGETIAAIVRSRPVIGVGIDLSVAAADHAARRYPEVSWVVANADRALPLLDRSVDLLLSQHGRRHPAESARVLRPGGGLLISVPAPDDLRELRAAVQGSGTTRSRIDAVISEHAADFDISGVSEVREQAILGRSPLLDLLRGTYRGERSSTAERIRSLDTMAVTLASTLLRLRRR